MLSREPVLRGSHVPKAPLEGVSVKVWRAKKHPCGGSGAYKEGLCMEVFMGLEEGGACPGEARGGSRDRKLERDV